ncbi:hypothetical protein MLD38_040500 [Melastoma candidum]|nr:hypothetical protein MLD38_040500 [Melastoma candidum]
MGQREIVFGAGLVQISIVDADSNLAVLLDDWHDVGGPCWVLRYLDEFYFNKLLDFLFDFQNELGFIPTSLLFDRRNQRIRRYPMLDDFGVEAGHISI